MDISTETDLNKLKALAYDQLAISQQAQRNIGLLENRIAEIVNAENDKKTDKSKAK